MSKDKYRPAISVDEVIRRDIPGLASGEAGGADAIPGDEVVDDRPGTGRGGGGRDAPQNLRIVSQTVYYSPEGHQYVEVEFEWDDVAGAEEYLIRVGQQ